jgi:hypothetical protein
MALVAVGAAEGGLLRDCRKSAAAVGCILNGRTDISAHVGASAHYGRMNVHTGGTRYAVSKGQYCARQVIWNELTVLEVLARRSPIKSACEVGVGVEVEGPISASHSFIHRHSWPVSERVIDMVKYRDGVGVLVVGEWGRLG